MTECSLLKTLWIESALFRDFLRRCGMDYGQASRTQLHVHHIFGGKTRKDLPSNTITICGAVHEFCHAHETEGRIACLLWKFRSGSLAESELDNAAGYSVTGWLHTTLHLLESDPFHQWASDVYHGLMLAAEQRRRVTAQ